MEFIPCIHTKEEPWVRDGIPESRPLVLIDPLIRELISGVVESLYQRNFRHLSRCFAPNCAMQSAYSVPHWSIQH